MKKEVNNLKEKKKKAIPQGVVNQAIAGSKEHQDKIISGLFAGRKYLLINEIQRNDGFIYKNFGEYPNGKLIIDEALLAAFVAYTGTNVGEEANRTANLHQFITWFFSTDLFINNYTEEQYVSIGLKAMVYIRRYITLAVIYSLRDKVIVKTGETFLQLTSGTTKTVEWNKKLVETGMNINLQAFKTNSFEKRTLSYIYITKAIKDSYKLLTNSLYLIMKSHSGGTELPDKDFAIRALMNESIPRTLNKPLKAWLDRDYIMLIVGIYFKGELKKICSENQETQLVSYILDLSSYMMLVNMLNHVTSLTGALSISSLAQTLFKTSLIEFASNRCIRKLNAKALSNQYLKGEGNITVTIAEFKEIIVAFDRTLSNIRSFFDVEFLLNLMQEISPLLGDPVKNDLVVPNAVTNPPGENDLVVLNDVIETPVENKKEELKEVSSTPTNESSQSQSDKVSTAKTDEEVVIDQEEAKMQKEMNEALEKDPRANWGG